MLLGPHLPHLLSLLPLPTALTPIETGVGGGGGNFGVVAAIYIINQGELPLLKRNAYMALQLVQGMQVDLLQELQHPVSSILSVVEFLNHVLLLTTTSWRCRNKSA